MNKAALRTETLAHRRAMNTADVQYFSSQITSRVIDLVDWQTIRRVHIYQSNSASNEVSTLELQRYIATNVSHAELTVGTASPLSAIPNDTYDLIIVPVVAFDKMRQRIGFGGGWYDRFLAKQPQAQKIGLAFESQRVDEVPAEPHDVPLDVVVTETKLY